MKATVKTVAVVGGALAILSTSTAAFAATAPPSLASVQAKGAKATSDRVMALTKAITVATADTTLTAPDKVKVLATLNADLSAMRSLASKIAADSTEASAQTDYQTIFTGYRVLAVAIPQARAAAAADNLTGATLAKLSAEQKSLAARLAGPDSAKSTAALQADLADMTAKIAAAQSAIDGIASKALAVTPAQFNADRQVLASIQASVKTARTDAAAARADGAKVGKALH